MCDYCTDEAVHALSDNLLEEMEDKSEELFESEETKKHFEHPYAKLRSNYGNFLQAVFHGRVDENIIERERNKFHTRWKELQGQIVAFEESGMMPGNSEGSPPLLRSGEPTSVSSRLEELIKMKEEDASKEPQTEEEYLKTTSYPPQWDKKFTIQTHHSMGSIPAVEMDENDQDDGEEVTPDEGEDGGEPPF